MKRILWTFIILCVCSSSSWATERFQFSSESNEKRYQAFVHGTRCMVCQNQSVAESSSMFSEDLKAWLYEAIEAGQTDPEIKMALVARFGDSVFYDPPLQANTFLLWGLPVLFVVIGGFVMMRSRRGFR